MAHLKTPPKKRPEELGFYYPDSPFAKIAEESGLDFNSDKKIKKAELSLQQKANDVFEEHHAGRRWAEKLALMTLKTGAYRELVCVCKTPYGGVDEDGVDPWVPMNQVNEAKEEAKRRTRVAARKYAGKPEQFKQEQQKIGEDLWKKIGSPKLPRTRDKNGSPVGAGSPTNIMDALTAQITPR